MLGVVLFLISNIAIVFTITILLSLFGINVDSHFVIFAIIIGFSGSIISLLLSKTMAKAAVGAHVITNPSNRQEDILIRFVNELSKKAGIKMPEVAIYDGAPNAFATGYNKNDALVAVSTGLLNSMNIDELKAVLAHEIAHIKNSDMITMSLLQGLINTFVILLARIISSMMSKNNNQRPNFMVQMALEVVLSLIGSIIVFWFSRHREYRADETSSELFSPRAMIMALNALKSQHLEPLPESMKTFGFVGFFSLFSTHPSLDDRIANIKQKFNVAV